jgi:hypothetical protein
MNDTNQGPKLEEDNQVPKADEPKSVPNLGENKQMPWENEYKQMSPKVPAPTQGYGPLRQSSSVTSETKPASAQGYSEAKEEPKQAPKVTEPKPMPMPAPKVVESKPAPMPALKVVEDKKMSKQDARKIIKIPKKKFVMVSAIIVIIILLALGAFFIMTRSSGSKNWSGGEPLMMNSGTPEENSLDILYSEKSPQYDYNRGYPEPSITDTREFMKINYSASIKTRKVEEVVNDVQNIVKGSNGRVDGVYSSKKNGYIRFIVAQSKFDTFKSQIENLTNKKLYTENISSENLLSQKQGIEEQTGNIVNTLVNLQAQKTSLDAKHAQTLNYINTEIARIRAELALIRTAIVGATNLEVLATLRSRESSYVRQETTQQQLLTSENSSYAIKSQNLESLINNENGNLTDVNKKDSQFIDNIETVNGYISVNWTSLWEMTRIFSPIPPILIVVILIIIIIFCLGRYNRIPKIELE